MSKELVISANRHETKVALIEDDQLVEVYFQRANEYSLAGSIHKGRVTRVLPGMQSAFVDVGLERDTFLYVSDFFEENEDIDTVEEKPIRGERRERGPAGNPERTGEERIAEPLVIREVTPEATEQAGGEAAEDEGGVPAAELAPVAEAPANGPGERSESERGFRGDRRGRRSRRRRQRGRGFPENKYAQPAGAPRISTGAYETPRHTEEPEQDVIMLPGESLAKYRNISGGDDSYELAESHEPADAMGSDQEGELSPEAVELAEEEAAEQEAIEEEAEAIALTDKVFGHNDDLSPAAEEEKIEEVKEDQPASEPSAGEERMGEARDLSSGDVVSQVIGMPWRAEAEPEQLVASEFDLESLPELPEGEAIEADEFRVLVNDDSLEAQGRDALESAESGDAAGTPRAQTAEVRERGGGYMHRVSRRMRRRRGGNRFPQQGAGSGGGADAGSGGTATAPAMQAETRREVEKDRTAEKPDRVTPSISELLKAGQEIIVQIAKEPLGQKGARITSHVALPGRYVVFMPSVAHLGVSRKIASDEERLRLKRILQTHREGTSGGFIVRTAGEGVPEEEIAADISFLYSLWL